MAKGDVVTYEIRPKGYDVFKNARNLEQSDDRFSRLYSTAKEYDLLRLRTRINGKLKPHPSIKRYYSPDESPRGIIDELINIHNRTDFYSLCSGGKDSISIAHFVSTNYPDNFKGIVFVDTGVGVETTKKWLIGYAEEMGWKLHILQPDPPDVYFERVKRLGFPLIGTHNIVMGYLKFRPMLRFMQADQYRLTHAAYMSGTRKFESHRRNITTAPVDKSGNLVFCSPFYATTTEDTYKYLITHNLKITPVHKTLGRSGECMCGSFPAVGERELLEKLDPELYKKIIDTEEWIREHGDDDAKKRSVWGEVTEGRKKKVKPVIDPNIEAIICGTECGGGTMRGMEAF